MSARRVLAFDSETGLIRPALLAPPLVCVTWQELGQSAGIEHRSTVEGRIRTWLQDPNLILVGHNVAYDAAVLCEAFPSLRPLFFDAYAADRVTDTMIRQHLLDTHAGEYRGRLNAQQVWRENRYDLQSLARRMANIDLVKDGWRMSYGEFLDTPLAEWPRRAREVQAAAVPIAAELAAQIEQAKAAKDAARVKSLTKQREGLVEMIASDPSRASEYPLDDARAPLAVYLAQEKHSASLHDQFRQARAAFALHLSSAWGLRTDAPGVDSLRAATQFAYDEIEGELIQLGFVRNDKKRTRDTKLAKARMVRVCKESGLPLHRTEGHADKTTTKCRDVDGAPLPAGDERCAEHVSLDAEACNATDDEVLQSYAEISTLKKVLSNDVEMLLRGLHYPVHTKYGYAETGRSTSSKPNIQNVGKRAGIRECFIARPGMLFGAADYPALESYTWAQCCQSWLGQSKLGEALNAGLDPHLAMAANILGCTYEEAKARYDAGDQEVHDVRQLAKVANFGFPGGMGPPKLLISAKKQLKPEVVARLGLDVERMKKLKTQWFETWPEAPLYFARINALCDTPDGRATVETLFTKRFRGGASYCAAANTGFQALGSDCAKNAVWCVAREQYNDPNSPLWNTRTVFFVHDEIGIEAPEATAHEAVQRLADVMVDAANVYLPNVPIPRAKVKPVLMRRWSKSAKPVLGADGRLVAWDM